MDITKNDQLDGMFTPVPYSQLVMIHLIIDNFFSSKWLVLY